MLSKEPRVKPAKRVVRSFSGAVEPYLQKHAAKQLCDYVVEADLERQRGPTF